MKKDKKKIGWALLEGLGELLLTLLCLAIGIFIVSLFGVDFESPDIEYDLIILLGLAVFFVIFGVVCALFQLFKKTIKGKRRKINTHHMKLNSSPFEMIKRGDKTIELRLFDEKRRKIKVGDIITFTNTANGEQMSTTVKNVHRFDSFDELYKSLPLLQCGYTTADIDKAHPSDMEQYYSVEAQNQYGVVGIELSLSE